MTTGETGRNESVFKDILTSENPGNDTNFIEMRGEGFRNTIKKTV